MKLSLFDRIGLFFLNSLLLAIAAPLWLIVMHIANTRGWPAVGW